MIRIQNFSELRANSECRKNLLNFLRLEDLKEFFEAAQIEYKKEEFEGGKNWENEKSQKIENCSNSKENGKKTSNGKTKRKKQNKKKKGLMNKIGKKCL